MFNIRLIDGFDVFYIRFTDGFDVFYIRFFDGCDRFNHGFGVIDKRSIMFKCFILAKQIHVHCPYLWFVVQYNHIT